MGDGDRTHIGTRLHSLQHCALYRRTIKLTCPGCQRVRRLDAIALWWLFECRRWDDRIPGAYRRLYCEPCLVTEGRKIAPVAEITCEQHDVEQPPYPDQRSWRQLVSRYRA